MKTITLKHWTGLTATCSVKEMTTDERGTVTLTMDTKKCNEIPASQYDPECSDCKVSKIVSYSRGKVEIWVRYKTAKGWTQGMQIIDAQITNID